MYTSCLDILFPIIPDINLGKARMTYLKSVTHVLPSLPLKNMLQLTKIN